MIPIATAGGVLVVLLVQRIGRTVNALVIGPLNPNWNPIVVSSVWSDVAFGIVFDIVFAGGVFLGLRFVSARVAGLRLGLVVVRSVLAAAAGSAFVFLAILVTGAYCAVGGVLGTQVGIQGDTVWRAVARGSETGGAYFVNSAPVVILAGILLWIWLKRQPHSHPIAGLLNAEV